MLSDGEKDWGFLERAIVDQGKCKRSNFHYHLQKLVKNREILRDPIKGTYRRAFNEPDADALISECLGLLESERPSEKSLGTKMLQGILAGRHAWNRELGEYFQKLLKEPSFNEEALSMILQFADGGIDPDRVRLGGEIHAVLDKDEELLWRILEGNSNKGLKTIMLNMLLGRDLERLLHLLREARYSDLYDVIQVLTPALYRKHGLKVLRILKALASDAEREESREAASKALENLFTHL